MQEALLVLMVGALLSLSFYKLLKKESAIKKEREIQEEILNNLIQENKNSIIKSSKLKK